VKALSDAVRNVVIVGGGSAGWLAAAVIAAEHCTKPGAQLRVTVVESPDVAPIGVGEGTWPTMRDTLRSIGVSESDFIRECDATFKQGSRFDRWVTGEDDDRYYHPFVLPHGYTDTNLVAGWLQRYPERAFASVASFQPHLCARDRAPKQASTPEYAAVANYAYHLDAGKFGLFLRKHCIERLGVVYLSDHVVDIVAHDDGDIASLTLKEHGALSGDLFVDCTGMQALLIGKHFGVEFISKKSTLFNDSALAVQVPYPREDQEIASQTISTAQRSGWIWDIGLPTRRGVGYVYSSAHTSDDAAEVELRAYLNAGNAAQAAPAVRKLRFEPGYRTRFWHRNCVAIGLSAGFIEPLEASAIALVELSAAMLRDQMPATRSEMDIVARRFNDAFAYRWERVIDFLKLHYVLTRRTDSDFWRDNLRADSIPERLQEQLILWRRRPPSRYDFHRIEEVFPSASYQYILYGMGFRPSSEAGVRRSDDPGAADGFFRETAQTIGRMLAALPSNRELIAHVNRSGFPRI
jgi:tryptophan 7-halogenase